ncbi:uncharacterized protein F4812DRAFT_458582 [Daldinia caldariorum]|uniref:uncharacterized protein n=1 Tax=Daldinia caldariorum TaxID=326644 RepID=UPI0020080714|nr:uncharacterized protein F4812DRAFT_458582 [Daldinia caldariorum]KAI1469057.1 hypothetical protein F4812DRAFT_458582 [Daldinia caldariorum]
MPPRHQPQGADLFHIPGDMRKVIEDQPALSIILRSMSWPKESYTDHKFVDIFQTVSGAFQNGAMDVIELHSKVDRRTNGTPSAYSRLFRTTEDKASNPEAGPLRELGNAGSAVGTYAREKALLGVRRYEAKAAQIAAPQPPPQPQLDQDNPAIPAAAGNNAMSHIGNQATEPWPTQREQPELDDNFGHAPPNHTSLAGRKFAPPCCSQRGI